MKKVIYLLVLCMVLGMAGCGTNQENKEPVSGNVSVETENKENDDVVQNEQIPLHEGADKEIPGHPV